MTAKIIQFPIEQPVTNLAPCLPSVPQLIVTIKRKYWHLLNMNEKHSVSVAEQLVMQGNESPTHMQYLHTLLLKYQKQTTFNRMKRWFGRRLTTKGQ